MSKMKRNSVKLVKAIILMTSLFYAMVSLPVSAQSYIFYASGTLDEYVAEGYDTGIIVSGRWRITINLEGDVAFFAQYVEYNLDEEIIGTHDHFTIYNDEQPSWIVDGDTWIIDPQPMVSTKMGWDNEQNGYGLPPGPRHYKEYRMPVGLRIDPEKIELYLFFQEEPYIMGTTHVFIN